MAQTWRPGRPTESRRSTVREGRLSPTDTAIRSLSVWVRHVVPYTVIFSLLYSPLIAYTLYAAHVADYPSPYPMADTFGTWRTVTQVGGALGLLIAEGAVIRGVVLASDGRRVPVLASVADTKRWFLPILGVTAWVSLWAALLGGIVLFLSALVGSVFHAPTHETAVIGLILAVIAVLAVLARFSVAVPVVVAEGGGVGRALRRSRELLRGNTIRLYVVLLVPAALAVGVHLLVAPKATTFLEIRQGRVLLMWLSMCETVVLGPFAAIAAAVAYLELRMAREGASSAELARVFE